MTVCSQVNDVFWRTEVREAHHVIASGGRRPRVTFVSKLSLRNDDLNTSCEPSFCHIYHAMNQCARILPVCKIAYTHYRDFYQSIITIIYIYELGFHLETYMTLLLFLDYLYNDSPLNLSVAVRKLQVAILARSSQEISQTVRINRRSFLSRVRISVWPSQFL